MYAPPPAIRDLWPTPALGDWAVRDVNRPLPIAGGDGFKLENDNIPDNDDPQMSDQNANTGIGQPVDPSTSQGGRPTGHTGPADYHAPTDGYSARRGVADRGAYAEQTYNKVLSHHVTHSLGRETLYNWADAQFNVGGVGYPLDFGFGPGYHGDATVEQGNVQLYMKPGIWRRPAAAK